jgi:hypothetical protein
MPTMDRTLDGTGGAPDVLPPRSGRVRGGGSAKRVVASGGRTLVVLVLAPLALAACGGSRSPAVAHLSTVATSGESASSGRPLDRFAACMRSHGVPQFPDPTNNGTNVKILIGGSGIDPATPQFNAAQESCSGLLPAGGNTGPTITPADRLDYLKAVACVRSHGVPDFPDPTFVNGQVSFDIPAAISRTSPVVEKAITTCRKLIPAGLPYSR